MKKFTFFLLTVFTFIATTNIHSQEMWGMTEYGGNDNVGVIYKTNESGNQFSFQYMFNDDSHASHPASGVILYDDNHLRGFTGYGGDNNKGTHYSISLSHNYFIKLKDFGGSAGAYPRGYMTLGDNGVYYGVTKKGGTNNYGTIYKVEGGVHSVIYNFNAPSSTDYCYPFSTLLYYNGNLYGIYQPRESYYDYGLFKYNISTGTLTHLAGINPHAGIPRPYIVLSDDNSTLYFNLNKKLYSYDLTSDALSMVAELTENFTQFNKLIKTSDGNYYTIINTRLYSIDMQNGTRTDKYVQGDNVVEASNGKLYLFNDHEINEYDPTNDSYQKIYEFNNPDGNKYRFLGNIAEKDGKLYGTTYENGKYDKGTIFSFDINTHEYSVIHDFKGATGFHPKGKLTKFTDGKLYGLTSAGYYDNNGSLFSFNPVTKAFRVKHYFGHDRYGDDDEDGVTPYAGLTTITFNDKDYMIGTTYWGGTNGFGTVFYYSPSSGYNKIVDFDGTNGKWPYGDVILASDGNLYGTTFDGGSKASGVIFKITPDGDLNNTSLSVIYNFGSEANDGEHPVSGLLEYSGFLWGVTRDGGDNDKGTVFAYLLSNGMYIKQASFNGSNGSHPVGNLVYYNGKIYGVTKTGGANDKGAIFEYNMQNGDVTAVHSFNSSGDDGYEPVGGLTASNNKLYGVCSKGGSEGTGTFFEFDPANATITHKTNLRGPYGASPAFNNGIITACIAREIIPDVQDLPVVTAQCEVTSLDPVTGKTNCGEEVTAVSDAELPITGEGTYTVTWTYSDNLGNVTTQEQTIIIDDTEAPVPNVTNLPDLSAECQINDPMRQRPRATDNCKGSLYASTDVTFPITDEGTTVITWTYDDGNGNVSTQTQNAIVGIDNTVTVNGNTLTANADGGYTYQWYQRSGRNVVLLNGETNRSITVKSGTFFVEISNGTCSTTSNNITVSTTGINDQDAISGISIYPNPVSDILTIENDQPNKITVSLFDVAGNKLKTINTSDGVIKIGMTEYPNGIYFIMINDNRNTITRKIVKK